MLPVIDAVPEIQNGRCWKIALVLPLKPIAVSLSQENLTFLPRGGHCSDGQYQKKLDSPGRKVRAAGAVVHRDLREIGEVAPGGREVGAGGAIAPSGEAGHPLVQVGVGRCPTFEKLPALREQRLVDDPVLPYSRRPLSGASCCDSRSTDGHESWLTVSIPSIVSPTPTILFSPWAATFAWAG